MSDTVGAPPKRAPTRSGTRRPPPPRREGRHVTTLAKSSLHTSAEEEEIRYGPPLRPLREGTKQAGLVEQLQGVDPQPEALPICPRRARRTFRAQRSKPATASATRT